MVWSQKELFYRSNFRVIHIELFVMTSGIFGFGKERIVVPFPKFALDLQQWENSTTFYELGRFEFLEVRDLRIVWW